MVKKIYATFFLIFEAGTLLYFLSHGIFGGLDLILLLLIVLNVIKLRSLFADKKESPSPGKPAGGSVNATGGAVNTTGGSVNAAGGSVNVDKPSTAVPYARISTEIPGTIPGEITGDTSGGITGKIPGEFSGEIPGEKEEFTEEQMEEYRAFAQKIMRENPDITIRQCLYCGGQFPFMLPRCPYCGR